MAEIKQYVAPQRRLTVPEGGFAALETAGRRVGPDYRQAGEDYARIGELQARSVERQRWPFDILELQSRSREFGGARRGGGGAGEVRIRGGSEDPFGQFGARHMPNLAAANAMIGGGMEAGRYMSSKAKPRPGGQLVDVGNWSKDDQGNWVYQGGGTTSIGRETFPGLSDPRRLIDTGYVPEQQRLQNEWGRYDLYPGTGDYDASSPLRYGGTPTKAMTPEQVVDPGYQPDIRTGNPYVQPSGPGIFQRLGDWLSGGGSSSDSAGDYTGGDYSGSSGL